MNSLSHGRIDIKLRSYDHTHLKLDLYPRHVRSLNIYSWIGHFPITGKKSKKDY